MYSDIHRFPSATDYPAHVSGWDFHHDSLHPWRMMDSLPRKWKVNKSSSPNLGCCANVWCMSISASWAPSGLPLWQDNNYNASESVTMSTSQSNRENPIYLSNLMAATLYSSVSSSSLKLILVSVFAWNQYCIYHRFHFQRHSWLEPGSLWCWPPVFQ